MREATVNLFRNPGFSGSREACPELSRRDAKTRRSAPRQDATALPSRSNPLAAFAPSRDPKSTVNLRAFLPFLALTFATPALAQEHDHSKMEQDMTMEGGAKSHDPSHQMDMSPPVIQPSNARQWRYITPCLIMDENGDALMAQCYRTASYADGTGTARQPGEEAGHLHGNIRDGHYGGWNIALHGNLSSLYTRHSGPRGADKAYATSMAMLMAERGTGWGNVQFRAMASAEPLMKNAGYPNLFATGESAGGQPLVDRQHPHDLFMELSGRVDVDLSETASLFLYGGPVGEPALGPAAFMHRGSAKLNPEPPITHHWFDSTHITYGVATAGFASRKVQLEASLFTGREPDERRWNIEKPRFDSWSVRATWTPTPRWAAQVSQGRIKEPEFSTHPGENEHRTTASVHYADGSVSAMLAFAAKNRDPGRTLTAWLAEANWDISDHHTLFGRIENVRNDELFPNHADPLHDVPFRVTKAQAGYAYRLPVSDSVSLALGGSLNAYAAPKALDAAYGRNPWGYTLFARLSLGH